MVLEGRKVTIHFNILLGTSPQTQFSNSAAPDAALLDLLLTNVQGTAVLTFRRLRDGR